MRLKNIAIIIMLCIMRLQADEFSIRFAQKEDIPAIVNLNQEVLDEYFKPAMIQGYPNSFGKNPELIDQFHNEWSILLKQLLEDTHNGQNNDHAILIASDNQDLHNILGACVFTKANDSLFIDFLAVSKESRGKGIGKSLLDNALSTHTNINSCTLVTLAYANEKTHQFYENYGFKNTNELWTLFPPVPNAHVKYELHLKK